LDSSDGRVSRVAAADERVCCGGAAEHSVIGAEAALKDEGPVVKSTAQIKNLCCCLLLQISWMCSSLSSS